jgi:type III secretion system low calcium response chaperone LcrH/SycD
MLNFNLDNVDPEAVGIITEAVMKEGYIFQDFSNITDEEMEATYAMAFNFVNQQHYSKAEKLGEFLCHLNHYESRFWLLLGICRQMTKNYSGAVQAYSLAGVNDPENPFPPLRAAECHLLLKDYEKAIQAAKAVLFWAADNPQMKEEKQRAELILQTAQQHMENSQ